MNIGQAAKASGVSAKMIRYYESIRLITAPDRSEAGYRRYEARDVEVLRFIRNARDLGFPLASIEALLSLWQDRSRRSAEVKALAEGHLAELDARIAALQAMRGTLGHLVDCCAGDDRPDCPILEGIDHPAPSPGPGPVAALAG